MTNLLYDLIVYAICIAIICLFAAPVVLLVHYVPPLIPWVGTLLGVFYGWFGANMVSCFLRRNDDDA